MKHILRILPLVITAMFASCSPAQNEQMSKNASSGYKELLINQITWSSCLKQKEDAYLIFFYSETCSHCHQIMEDVIAFAHGNIIKTYFLDIKKSLEKVNVSSDIEKTIGVNDVKDLFIKGTPSIVEVIKGTVNNNIAGTDSCLSFLNQLRLNFKLQ